MGELPACVCPHVATRDGLVRSGWASNCHIHNGMPVFGTFESTSPAGTIGEKDARIAQLTRELQEARGLLIDSEALLCDERAGRVANELASRIRALAKGEKGEKI